MGKVHVLDQAVANMIAAGEVVERPSSVVKELAENSVDAGASLVTIEIKNGGRTYIRITDNGSGMTREDAELSLLRHATSKVSGADDLSRIVTLGFRGEALASIAAVSSMEIITRPDNSELGTRIFVRAGTVDEIEETGCPKGTTMVIRDLFSNVPARLKFLKKDVTEAGYVTDVVNRLALSNPQVSVRYIRDGKEILYTAGDASIENSVFSVFGREVAKAMLPVEHEENHIHVSGLTGKAEISRANRNFQNFFINGRYIRSALLAHAMDEAYKNQLMTGKFPSCVLNLTVDPSFVDVNVHPTKLEVKFSDERAVYHAVYWAVRNALYQKPDIPEVTVKEQEIMPKPLPEAAGHKEPVKADSAPLWGAEVRKPQETPAVPEPERVRPFNNEVVFTRPQPVERRERGLIVAQEDASESEKTAFKVSLFEKTEPKAEPEPQEAPVPPMTEYGQEAVTEQVEPQVIGQVFATYIVVEKGDEMYLIDQHAAHERLRYEELRKQAEQRAVVSQGLLVPIVVDLTGIEMAVILDNLNFFEGLGFELEAFGNASVIIRSTPEELDSGAMKEFFVECVDMLRNQKNGKLSELQSHALYSISCKGALKANKKLDKQAMESLVSAVFALPNINTCPHGRPIVISFTKRFVEKQFKRVL